MPAEKESVKIAAQNKKPITTILSKIPTKPGSRFPELRLKAFVPVRSI